MIMINVLMFCFVLFYIFVVQELDWLTSGRRQSEQSWALKKRDHNGSIG